MQPTEIGKVELKLSGDPRLLAGVCGAVNHVAEAAGMDEAARATLVAAIEDACNEVFRGIPQEKDYVEMSLAVVPGGVEVVLGFRGKEASAGRMEKIQSVLKGRVDHVAHESRDGRARLTVVKTQAVRPRKR